MVEAPGRVPAHPLHLVYVADDPRSHGDVPGWLRATADDVRVTVTGSDEAAAVVAEADPDCVVARQRLDGTDGVSLLADLAGTDPRLPTVVAFDADADGDVAAAALAAGLTDYARLDDGDGYAPLVVRVRRAVRDLAPDDEGGRITALHDVAVELTDCEVEGEVYRTALDAAERVLDLDACALYVAEDGELVPRALSRSMLRGAFRAYDLDEGVMGETYRTKQSFVSGDVTNHDDSAPSRSDLRSGLSVPVGDVGVLQAVSQSHDAFDGADLELAELLASHVATAVSRIRSDRRLRHERDRFAALFETVPDPAVVHSREGETLVVRAVNPAFEETFGYDEADLVGEELGERIAVEDDDLVEVADAPPGEVVVAEVRRVTADGPRDFLFRGFRVEVGDVSEEFGVYTDITERMERERRLQRQNERLEEFAGVVSHDLRNPLTVARGHLDIARTDDDPEALASVDRALQRMESLVDDLLALARVAEPAGSPEAVPLADAATRAWSVVDTGDATLSVTTDRAVAADEGQLRRLLENLFANAIEHGSSTPPAVDADPLTVTVGDTPDGFYVADDGRGIDPENRETVFDRGYSTADDGTGFGMAIVERIAQAHGWSVRVTESETGGARFEFDC